MNATERRNAHIAHIASAHLGLDTLETRRGGLDHSEQAVWNLRSALEAAHEAGATATAIEVAAEVRELRERLAEMVAAYGTGSYGTKRQDKAIAAARKALGA